mgnify:CR=1 FL=1
MKLRSKNSRKKSIISIIAILSAIIILVLFATLAIQRLSNSSKLEDQTVKDIFLTSPSKRTVYYVGEEFDPTGLQIQVIAGSNKYTRFVNYGDPELTVTGFDSSTVNEALPITVSYMGFTTTFNVQVKEHENVAPTLQSIDVINFKTTYSLKDWNMFGPESMGATIKCTYSDGSVVENIALKDKNISGVTQVDGPCTTEITVEYNDGATVVSTQVTITITE